MPSRDLDPGKVYYEGTFLEDAALMQLLNKGGLFVMFHGGSLTVTVNCNDVFAWACADCEDITSEEDLKDLYDASAADPKWGMLKWACKKRGEKPQRGWIAIMKHQGSWDETMESLSENKYDACCDAEKANKSNA